MNQLFMAILSLLLTSALFPATKEDLYFSGGKTDFGCDLATPEKGKLKLPYGSANVQSVVETNGYVIGLTRPEYKKRSPLLFRFSLKETQIKDYTDFDKNGEAGKQPAYGLAVAGNRVYAGTYATGKTGNLIAFDVIAQELKAVNLGAPKAGEGIFCLTASKDGQKIFGTLFPSNSFFVYDIAGKTFKVIGGAEIDSASDDAAMYMHMDSSANLCRSLGVDNAGNVYGSTGMGKLFCYNPALNQIKPLTIDLPYSQNHKATNRVESWSLAPNGKLYGGTSIDGYLFCLDPASGKRTNLGKPIAAGNLRSLAVRGNKVYGLCGELPEYTHFFTYDLSEGEFEDLGLLRFKNRMINSKQMSYTVSNLLPLSDGRLLFTENDLLPSLVFYNP
ncbi:MAG: hypothetical protein V1913_15890 [Fibrobacterota bacterium]